jgi:phospholipid/cholesterol/gamma-HCH transport system substrate-binding protein
VSSPVTINGFKVGQVRDINYEYDNPGHVLVELSLDKKLKVPSGSKAIIKSDLLGTASVELQFSTSADSHDVGDKLIGEAMPSMLDTEGFFQRRMAVRAPSAPGSTLSSEAVPGSTGL